jgi:hypothetical protein
MRTLLLLYLTLLTWGLLASNPLVSWADSHVEDDFQSWNLATITFKKDEKYLGYFEVQPRIGNNVLGPVRGPGDKHFAQLVLRPALGYQITPNISLWQGYAWVPSNIPTRIDENRIYQQLQINNAFSKLTMVNRSRLEQRWFEGADGTAVRARHMVRLAIPFTESKKWSWILYDELFVNLNGPQGAPKAGFDQNRAFIGLNRTFNRNVNAEIGYLNNYVNRADPVADRMNHVLLLGVYFTVD